MSYIIGVDCGGTFTDSVIMNHEGQLFVGKVPSTPSNYAEGVFNSIYKAISTIPVDKQQLFGTAQLFGHATTVATNTLLTRTGSRVALLTTLGHEDAIIIGRTFQKAAGLSDDELGNFAVLDKAEPIVPRALIRGVSERVDWQGKVVVPLSMAQLASSVEQLISQNVTEMAICFLWSFVNPKHEHMARQFLQEHYPQITVTISSDLVPILGEYERAVTTVVNAYIARDITSYLTKFETRLSSEGYKHRAYIMQSSGGIISVEQACERPVALLSSGPAGGVLAASKLGEQLGFKNIITTDVGGTSFDVGLIVDGEPEFSETTILSKYQLLCPSIDTISIGAGGGSIAWVEPDTNILKVGPQSAGADPGPSCFAKGGVEPTVTDANLVLGRLDPEAFLNGQQHLDLHAARTAIIRRIAEPLGWSLEQAAIGILEIADAHMADLIRKSTIERGHNPSDFVLLAFGGSGPLHVGSYARNLNIQAVIVPPLAAAFSAFGVMGADVSVIRELSRPMVAPFNMVLVDNIFSRLKREAQEQLSASGIDISQVLLMKSVTIRYRGQVHEVRIKLTDTKISSDDVSKKFRARYEQKYGPGTTYDRAELELVGCRILASGRAGWPVRLPAISRKAAQPSPMKQQHVYFAEVGGWTLTPVYTSAQLGSDHVIVGPAIIQAPNSTLVVHPTDVVTVDKYGDFMIHFG